MESCGLGGADWDRYNDLCPRLLRRSPADEEPV